MRRTGCSPLPTGGRRPFHYYHCTCSLPFSASAACSPRILPGNHRAKYKEGQDRTPKEQGMPIWRSGNIHEKASTGPTAYTFSWSQDTHTLLRRLITAGDLLPPRGPRMRGQKHNYQIPHHRTLHMSTTSRDATPPRGEQKQKSVTTSNKTASPQRPKNIIIYDFQYPTTVVMITTTTVAIQHEPQHSETREVGLYTHKHATYTYTTDFSRQRKELSRSREKSEGFKPTPLSKFQSHFLSPNISVFSTSCPVTYSAVLP